METYRLDGEYIIDPSGQPMRFYLNKDGYREASMRYLRWRKKMLEHRFKFLLHHRWLPATIDHINGVRHDNRLANLRASTSALQQANTRRTRVARG